MKFVLRLKFFIVVLFLSVSHAEGSEEPSDMESLIPSLEHLSETQSFESVYRKGPDTFFADLFTRIEFLYAVKAASSRDEDYLIEQLKFLLSFKARLIEKASALLKENDSAVIEAIVSYDRSLNFLLTMYIRMFDVSFTKLSIALSQSRTQILSHEAEFGDFIIDGFVKEKLDQNPRDVAEVRNALVQARLLLLEVYPKNYRLIQRLHSLYLDEFWSFVYWGASQKEHPVGNAKLISDLSRNDTLGATSVVHDPLGIFQSAMFDAPTRIELVGRLIERSKSPDEILQAIDALGRTFSYRYFPSYQSPYQAGGASFEGVPTIHMSILKRIATYFKKESLADLRFAFGLAILGVPMALLSAKSFIFDRPTESDLRIREAKKEERLWKSTTRDQFWNLSLKAWDRIETLKGDSSSQLRNDLLRKVFRDASRLSEFQIKIFRCRKLVGGLRKFNDG